jgi:SAM-dependent methyltransferase
MMSGPPNIEDLRKGIHGPLASWLEFNRIGAFETPGGLELVAPFPPAHRMQITTGLTDPKDFASHGYDVLKALSEASPRPIASFKDVLDFGVGAGRLARMFKGFTGRYSGVDVDRKNILWIKEGLPYVDATRTRPKKALPFGPQQFDLIVSISVFSHMNEKDHLFYLQDLARLAKPGAIVMLSIHGERALHRTETEPNVFAMMEVSKKGVRLAREAFGQSGFHFIRQWRGHLNSLFYAYGITFISESYVKREWSTHFDVIGYRSGAIHDFQDIVVLQAR